MGDRFYMQQAGSSKRRSSGKKNKLSKADMAQALGIPALEKLLVKDLERLTRDCFKNKRLNMPEGRFKKPYIKVCEKISSTVDWSKLTVKDLKQIILLNH